MLKVLSFSYCFPNHLSPTWGVFVYQRLAALAKLEDLQLCSPVPWFPFFSSRHGNIGPILDDWQGLTVHRPRFFYFPGFLKNHDARLYALGLRRWLTRLCLKWRPDVLDAHFIWPDGVAVASLAKQLKVPYVITLRGKIYECLPIASQRKQCAEALSYASAVISNSTLMAEEAMKLGTPEDRLFLITNGVDHKLFYPRDKGICRNKLGLPQNGRILVTASHLGHRKGHHEVIHVLSNLPTDVRLVIVGGPAQGGTPDQLRALAAKQGVGNRLILTGRQPYEKLPLYFSAADASVLASYREGCPNAVLESLACGTPVVATDVGAVRDILPEPGAGRIVPPLQVEPLREALSWVLEQEWDAKQVAKTSSIKSWNEIAQAVQGVLRKALA